MEKGWRCTTRGAVYHRVRQKRTPNFPPSIRSRHCIRISRTPAALCICLISFAVLMAGIKTDAPTTNPDQTTSTGTPSGFTSSCVVFDDLGDGKSFLRLLVHEVCAVHHKAVHRGQVHPRALTQPLLAHKRLGLTVL